ncbi:cutinase family protein [Gordonia paraffinivorans]|uniref:cutinase family protein n=1 Tax=Gordonia paraffinivorans TaxID=175628 RepID=UPI003FCDB4A3
MTTSVLFCDGTWSRPGARSQVAEALRHELSRDPRIRFEYVNYAADYGPATGPGDVAYAESVAHGVTQLERAVERTPYPAVVAGYSQGAAVAVHFARNRLPARRQLDVRAVATMGDPHTPQHDGRSGIAGALTVPRRRLTVWAVGDPIADLPLGSPLRTVADLSDWMSVRSLEAGREWALRSAAKVPSRLQQWWNPLRWQDLVSAVDYARNYLGTAHTSDYIYRGHVARLARMIEGVVV